MYIDTRLPLYGASSFVAGFKITSMMMMIFSDDAWFHLLGYANLLPYECPGGLCMISSFSKKSLWTCIFQSSVTGKPYMVK